MREGLFSEPLLAKEGRRIGNNLVYEKLYVFKAEPGRYNLMRIGFYIGTVSVPNSTGGTDLIEYTFNLYPSLGFELEDPGCYVLGTLTVDIAGTRGKFPNYSIDSSVYVDNGREETGRLFSQWQSGFPQTAAVLQSSLQTAYMKHMMIFDFRGGTDDLNRDASFWNENRNMRDMDYYYPPGKPGYSLNKKIRDDRYYFKMSNQAVYIPDRAVIEWQSHWDAKAENKEPYGLMLGTDTDNSYFFAENSLGQNGVFLLRRGEWEENILNFDQKTSFAFTEGQPNYHRIERENQIIRYFVNDKLICEFRAVLNMREPAIGFFSGAIGEATFDYLIISDLD